MKEKKKRQSLASSFKHAGEGILHGIKAERNMKIHVGIMCLVILLGRMVHLSQVEWYVCIILFAMVIGLELVNCAVEAVVDMVTEVRHPLAKVAKDTAAGAVLVCAISAIMIGCMLFIPKIIDRIVK